MRKLILIVLLAVVVGACGGSGDSAVTETSVTETSANGAESSTAAPQPTEVPPTDDVSESSTSAAPTSGDAATDAPSFDGPPAPDFELALADGSSFVLSDEQKPVYLVFWAEW